MAITSKDGILKVLTAYNPWWKTGMVNPKMTKTYKRFAFHEAMKRLKEENIRRTVVLTGTRRVGKTTKNRIHLYGSSNVEIKPISGCFGLLP